MVRGLGRDVAIAEAFEDQNTLSHQLKYRPEIDGLRALAVIPVVLYHAKIPLLSGGFAGVDVFFVISGFLITNIIAKDAQEGEFSFWRFYERRARRILPALFFVILAIIPIAWLVMVPYQLEDFTQSIIATLAFVSNVLFWFEADYFAVEADYKPLLHTWSLAVEEQFYLFFPILMVLLYRVSRRFVPLVLLILGVMSFVAAIYMGQRSSAATFFLFHYRAWELLVGSLAAIYVVSLGAQTPRPRIAALGVFAVALSFFVVSPEPIWPGYSTLLPVFGTVMVILFANSEAGVGRLLSWSPVRFVGLISYSLYLWHLPLLVFLNIRYFGDPPLTLVVLAVILSFVMSVVSWYFVEQPFRSKQKISTMPFSVALVAAMIPMGVFGGLGVQTSGFQAFKLSQLPEEFAERAIDREAEVKARKPVWNAALSTATDDFTNFEQRQVLILGDSLSGDLFVALTQQPELFPEIEVRRLRLDDRCMSLMVDVLMNAHSGAASGDGCSKEVSTVLNSSVFEAAEEIVLATNWQVETAPEGLNLAELLIDEERTAAMLGVAAFNDMASLSMQLGTIDIPLGDFLYQNIRSKFLPINQRFEDAANNNPRLRYLDKLALFCDASSASCDMLDRNERLILFDNAHVTVDGVLVFSERIAQSGWFE